MSERTIEELENRLERAAYLHPDNMTLDPRDGEAATAEATLRLANAVATGSLLLSKRMELIQDHVWDLKEMLR